MASSFPFSRSATIIMCFAKRFGSGLSRDAFVAEVQDWASGEVFALVPNQYAAADYSRHAVTELRLLHALSKRQLASARVIAAHRRELA